MRFRQGIYLLLMILSVCGSPAALKGQKGRNVFKISPFSIVVGRLRAQYERVIDTSYSLGFTCSYHYPRSELPGYHLYHGWKGEVSGLWYFRKKDRAPGGWYLLGALMGGLHSRAVYMPGATSVFDREEIGYKKYAATGIGAGIGRQGFERNLRLCYSIELFVQGYVPLKYQEYMNPPGAWGDEVTSWFRYEEGSAVQLRFMVGYRF